MSLDTQSQSVIYCPDGQTENWKVIDFVGLGRAFPGISAASLPAFHALAQRAPRAWQIVRMRYGINPVVLSLDTDARYTKAWSALQVSMELGIEKKVMDMELQAISTLWKKADHKPAALPSPVPQPAEKPAPKLKAIERPAPQRSAPKQPESDGSTVTVPLSPLEGDEANLMLQYDFPDRMFEANLTVEEAESERRWCIGRVTDMKKQLDEPAVCAIARQMIVNELQIRRLDKAMACLSVASEQYSNLQEVKKLIEQNYNKQVEQVSELFPWQVGAKIQAGRCFSDAILAMQEYYAKGSNARIDGFLTALEIQIELRAAEQHPVRYRPGQVAAINNAMSGLWDPNWKRKFSDAQCKALDEGFRGAYENWHATQNIQLPDLESDDPKRGEYPPLFVPKDEDDSSEPTESVQLENENKPQPLPQAPTMAL